MTEQELRQRVVSVAKGWLGVKGGTPEHHTIVDVYNAHRPLARGYKLKYTDAWCAGFASAVAIDAGLTDIIPTEVGCEEHIRLFQAVGRWVEDDAYTPMPGDYIFYDWQDKGQGDNRGYADHVGIVEKVVDNTITVIEGNKGNAVARRSLKVNGRYIRGYGVPPYNLAAIERELGECPKGPKGEKGTTCTGCGPSPWYDEAQRWAKRMGIADGTRPEEPATRAEVWTMLMRLASGHDGAGKE